MTNKSPSKESKLSRILKAPLRILGKARDFYMKSMIICDGQVGYGNYMGCPSGHPTTLPKSFSVSSSKSSHDDEDFRELVRVASTRRLGNKIELDLQRRVQPIRPASSGVNHDVMPRSYSVGIGRIDEDKPCDFGEDLNVKTPDLYPRSRSHAVSSKRNNYMGVY